MTKVSVSLGGESYPLAYAISELAGLLEDAPPTSEILDQLGRLFESGAMISADWKRDATNTCDLTLRIEPSKAFLVLLAAMRAGKLDLELTENLIHGRIPSLVCFATTSNGGEGEGVKLSPEPPTDVVGP